MANLLTSTAKKTLFQEVASDRDALAIAAVDFGTTFCSLAYSLSNKEAVSLIELNPSQTRVPTSLLLQRTADGTLQVRDFGFEAQSEATKLIGDECANHVYFELVKMLLYNTQVGNTINLPVKSLTGNGEQFYLVEAIAFVLKHMKHQLAVELSRAAPRLKASDMHWVITVPAIWKPDGKQLMREAAYKACLVSDGEGITQFTPYGKEIIRNTDIGNNDHLSLALEPECVAIYCHQLPNDRIALYAETMENPDNIKSHLILDIGGGTVDITALTRVNEDSFEVTVPPTGNECGGKEVNQQFKEFLEKIVQDQGFKRFLKKGKNESCEEHQTMLQKIIYHDFEHIKVKFGGKAEFPQLSTVLRKATSLHNVRFQPNAEASDGISLGACNVVKEELRLELPQEFLKCYPAKNIAKQLKNDPDVQVHVDRRMLTFTYSKMASFFEPVLQQMKGCVIKAVQQANGNGLLDLVCIAGGFGGCKYVFGYLKNEIKQIAPSVPLLVPADYKLAVSRGAVLYARNPGAVTIRTIDASYGIRVSKKFQKDVHQKCNSYQDEDGSLRCGNIFKPFVLQGDKVKATDAFTITVIPQFQSVTKAQVGIYSSTNPNVQYTTDEQTHKIGEIMLDVPNPTDLPVSERTIEVTMSLSSTEIKVHARALYLPDKPIVTAVLDFLTN